MKNLKMIYSLLVVLVAGFFAACTNDNTYTAGEVPSGPQVCFSNDNITSINLTGDADEESPKLVLTRIVADNELKVMVVNNSDDFVVGAAEEETGSEEGTTRAEVEKIFSIADEVVFKKGEKKAELEIKVLRPEALVEDKVYSLEFTIFGDVTTPYGADKWTLDIKLFPWSLIIGEKTKAEKGKFRAGDAFTGLFEAESVLAEVDVKVYEHKSKKGMYLVEDPWIKVMVPTFGYESEEAVLNDDVAHTTAHLVINCVDPNKCYIEDQEMGVDLGGEIGKLRIASDYHPEDNPEGIAGTFEVENKVLTWPAKGLITTAVGAGASVYSNLSGAFRLVLPDGEAVDYALAVDYKGMSVSPDNQTVTASFVFEHGIDVTGVKYYFADGNVLAAPADAISALLKGTASKIYSIEEFQAGTQSTIVNMKMEKAGVFTIVAAPMDKSSNLVEKFVALDSFYYSGVGDTGSLPCDITLVTGKYTEYNKDDAEDDTADHNAIGYNIKGKDIKALRIGAWLTTELDEYLKKEGNSYKSLFDEEQIASLTIEELVIVNSEAGKNGALDGLEVESDYTVVVLATNDYDQSATLVQNIKTGEAPAYSGELKIGQYLWKYEDKDDQGVVTKSYECVLNVDSNQGSSTKFLVSNLGYNDGSQWYAVYDAEAGTLTLDGTVKGREKEGNLFGVIFGKMENNSDYMYASVAAANSAGKNNDPLVFTVDKTSKELTGTTNKSFKILTRASGKTSTYIEFDGTDKTTLAPYVEEEGKTPETPETPASK